MFLKINGVRVISPDRLKLDDFKLLEHEKVGESNRAKRVNYCNDFACFDIETSCIKDLEQSFMYISQIYIQNQVVIMRTWDEVKEVFALINSRLEDKRLIIYVHNLSYEAQFMLGIFHFDSLFILEKRKIVKMILGNLEFRCSYIQTNKSLKNFTKGFKHEKLDGDDFDYNEIRYPWTVMTKEKLQYCVNDVVGLYEAMQYRLKSFNDTLYTIPLTSTGYVRRLAKTALQPYQNRIKSCQCDEKCYHLLRECFRGGDTHANRYYANTIVENVTSYDMSSAYPYAMISEKYPWKFEEYELKRLPDLHKIMNTNRAVICRLKLKNLHLKNEFFPVPYIAVSKSRNIRKSIEDNGRIISADYIEISVTEIDYRIIEKDYDFEVLDVTDIYTSKRDYLPKELRDLICQLFDNKTKLKGIEDKQDDYMKSKNLLNSVYGMMVTDVMRNAYEYNYETGEYIENDSLSYEKAIKNAFMLYQWGVYVTAYCRRNLHYGIEIAGEYHVYNDTDSVKFIDSAEIRKAFEEYNKSIKRTFISEDKHGIKHIMGLYEFDGEYQTFKTMGAKKYCYVDQYGLHVTISGVNKIKGAIELEKHGGIDAMQEGFVFVNAGGLQAVYNDDLRYDNYKADGKEVEITRNICLLPSTYTLGLTGEYQRLLKFVQLQTQNFVDIDE